MTKWQGKSSLASREVKTLTRMESIHCLEGFTPILACRRRCETHERRNGRRGESDVGLVPWRRWPKLPQVGTILSGPPGRFPNKQDRRMAHAQYLSAGTSRPMLVGDLARAIPKGMTLFRG